MFLASEAWRSLDDGLSRGWEWQGTTILFVSWDWGPSGGAEALAGRRLVACLLRAGARVHVLTAGGTDEALRCRNYDATAVAAPSLSSRTALRTWQMLRRGIPEGAGLWVEHAVRAGSRVLTSLPSDTIIYGRAMPGSSNIVAWHLARQRAHPWVAHFSDPWPPVQIASVRWNPLAQYKRPLYRFWRRRILDGAGALTFTNPQQSAAFLGRDRERYGHKAFVVTHLPSAPARATTPSQYDRFHIVHTGNFYSKVGQTTAAVMQGLRLFLGRTPGARSLTRFTQAGWADGDLPEWTARCGLDDVVQRTGRRPPSDVAELLDDASLLIAVDYARPGSTTLLSKLPDYITAGRPVLAVTGRGSAMDRLFTEDGAGLTAHYGSPEEVADRIAVVFRAWQQRRIDPHLPAAAAVQSFTPERALAELAGACIVARRAHDASAARHAARVTLLDGRTAS